MDLQAFIDSMNEAQARARSDYHLTYGELVDALKSAPEDAQLDERVKGIGSWRGSYTEIALFTDENGFYVEDEEFNGNYKEYDKWAEKHSTEVHELPRDANELGDLLESLIDKDFIGYKGGNFTIERFKPLWLEKHSGDSSRVAITGITADLKLITKEEKS